MTSNIGSRHLLEGVTGDSIPEAVRESVMADLRKAFRPEFLNRVDETILFKPLTLEEITTIVDLLLADLNKRLADRRVTVKLDKKAKDWVAEKGYDPVFGARPLKPLLKRRSLEVLLEESEDRWPQIAIELFLPPRLKSERMADAVEENHFVRHVLAFQIARQFLRLQIINGGISAAV
jgi:hypothetical protein